MRTINNKTPLTFVRGVLLGGQLIEINLLAFAQPLVERSQASTRDEDAEFLARSRVCDRTLLQIGHLAALGLVVSVANIIANQGLFASNDANLRHKGVLTGWRQSTGNYEKSQLWLLLYTVPSLCQTEELIWALPM